MHLLTLPSASSSDFIQAGRKLRRWYGEGERPVRGEDDGDRPEGTSQVGACMGAHAWGLAWAHAWGVDAWGRMHGGLRGRMHGGWMHGGSKGHA